MERLLPLRYAATLSFVALLAGLAFWNIHSLSALHQESAYFMDLAASQMGLVQRLAADSVRLDLAADPQERARIADSARQIAERIGNSHLLLTGEAAPLPDYYRYSGSLRALYYNQPLLLDQQVRNYVQLALNLLAEADPTRRASLRDSLLYAAGERLPEALRLAARLYRDEARTKAANLRLMGLGILTLTLGLLLVDLTLVFRPMLRHVTAARQSLGEMARRVETAAATDSLTSLLNRAKFNEVLEREVSAARRYGNPLSLLLLDVDHFNRINNDYGLETGDRLLAELALLVKNNLRITDHAFRLDGEVFAVLATQTPLEGAAALGEKLRRLAKGFLFGTEPLTLSLGLAAFRRGDERESLLSRATEALKEAKAKGRDRLEIEAATA
jgi:diguanylate cyclase (GGDEF)-like protein